MSTEEKTEPQVVCKKMAFYCFDALIDYLDNSLSSSLKPPSFTNDAYPLFVTWRKGANEYLRGCIGTFSPQPLHRCLKEYAIESAVNDSRFSPVNKDEVKHLHVSVSLLTNFEPASNYLDWIRGKHGIQIHFAGSDGRSRSSTYLPEVAVEHNLSKEEAIDQLIKKAGYRGSVNQSLLDSIRVTRYQSEKVSVSYDEYMQHLI